MNPAGHLPVSQNGNTNDVRRCTAKPTSSTSFALFPPHKTPPYFGGSGEPPPQTPLSRTLRIGWAQFRPHLVLYAYERLKAYLVRARTVCMAPYVLHCWSHGQERWRGHHWQWLRPRLHQSQPSWPLAPACRILIHFAVNFDPQISSRFLENFDRRTRVLYG